MLDGMIALHACVQSAIDHFVNAHVSSNNFFEGTRTHSQISFRLLIDLFKKKLLMLPLLFTANRPIKGGKTGKKKQQKEILYMAGHDLSAYMHYHTDEADTVACAAVAAEAGHRAYCF